MQNGSAFTAFINETINELSGMQVVAYYAEPLPAAPDGRFQQIITRFSAASPTEREQFQQALNERQRSLFGIFGHRAATLAARTEEIAWLKAGLIGAAISNYIIPEKRRVEMSLAVFHHVARKLNQPPVDLFEETAVYASDAFAPTLLAFGRKAAINLSSYGWRELKTDDGIKYKFEWG